MRHAHRALLGLSALLVAAGGSLVAVAAVAAPVPETGENGLLTLDADPYPAQDIEIERGERVLWPVTADLDAPTTGELSVRIVSEQPLAESPNGLRFELASCAEPWVLPAVPTGVATCDGGAGVVEIADSAFATTDEGRDVPLGPIAPGVPRYFLVTLSLPLSTPGTVADEPAELSFGFLASDPEPVRAAEHAAQLAATGGGFLGPVVVGLGLLVGGVTLARARRAEASS